MYSDSVLKKYIDIIKASNGKIKAYFQGDPVRIPTSSLPCVIVTKSETRVGQITNAEDEHGMGITITVITDIRQDLSTNENDAALVEGVSSLYDIVEGRNDDYTLKSTSILDILRSNQLLDVANNLRTDLSSITRIDYGQSLRQRQPELWSVEARIEIVAQFIQIRV